MGKDNNINKKKWNTEQNIIFLLMILMSLDLKRPEVVFTAKIPEKRGFSRSILKWLVHLERTGFNSLEGSRSKIDIC